MEELNFEDIRPIGKIKICPYGFHINTEDNECNCGEKPREQIED